MKLFLYGLRICSKIFNKIFIFNNKNEFPEKINEFSKNLRNIYLYSVENKYPAENPGLQCFLTNSSGIDILNINCQAFTLIEIGNLFITGNIIRERYISISGNGVQSPKHLILYPGSSLKLIFSDLASIDPYKYRILSGGLLTGKKILLSNYLSDDDLSLQVILEDRKRVLFSFFRLGLNELTLLKTWLSGFFPKNDYNISTSNHGEERACIQCGYCFDICPVQLMPSLIMKSAVINDIEKMEYINIHDCIECELCTFICPSKIELGQHIKYGKEFIRKEG
jgi:Na+-transporting NADH:ubiquinone oxidoreductase subunit A